MEYETISKETPEMKQFFSGIRNLTKRVRTTTQTHGLPVRGQTLSRRARDMRKVVPFSPYLTGLSGQGHFPIYRLQERFSIVCPTCNGFCKRII